MMDLPTEITTGLLITHSIYALEIDEGHGWRWVEAYDGSELAFYYTMEDATQAVKDWKFIKPFAHFSIREFQLLKTHTKKRVGMCFAIGLVCGAALTLANFILQLELRKRGKL